MHSPGRTSRHSGAAANKDGEVEYALLPAPVPLPARCRGRWQRPGTRSHKVRATMLHFIGIDLAWAGKAKPNESGIVMLDQAGTIVSADWAVGIDE